MSVINLMIILINLMIAIDATTKADNVVALFKFLPSNQYHQLKPQIFRILNNRPLSKQPISYQARSITTDILNAFHSVIAVHSKGRLTKRMVNTGDEDAQISQEHSVDPEADEKPRKSSHRSKSDYERSQSFKDASDAIKVYGFMDIFELNSCELQLIEDIMTGSKDELEEAARQIRLVVGKSIDAFGESKVSDSILNELDHLDELSSDEKRTKLVNLYKKVWRTIHPDKVAASKKGRAEEICKEHGEGLNNMKKKLSGVSIKESLILSDERYQDIIERMKLYEDEANPWFIPSFLTTETGIWEKLRAKASDFAAGVSQKDIADIQKVLEYKRNDEEIPYSFQMAYFARKNTEFFDLITAELDHIDEYLYNKVSKGGPKLYKSIKWRKLQAPLEERYEALQGIQDYVLDGQRMGNTRLKYRESTNYYYQTTGLYYTIGFFVFLAVVTWLKDKMIQNIKWNRPSNYDDELDDDSIDYRMEDFDYND